MKAFWIPSLLVLFVVLKANASDLMITGVFDGPRGGGLPKGIEIYVAANIDDLSEFSVGSANNGEGSDGPEFALPADSAEAGDFIYIASEEAEFDLFFGFFPTYTSGSMRINGDDAIELFRNDLLIDVFGDVDLDGSGQPWEYADGWAYRQSGEQVEGTQFALESWTFSGPDAWDGFFTNDDSDSPLPIGSYSPSMIETPRLQAGDADRDLDFDQFDLIQVQVAAKYLTGESATWGEGDWDAAPGGQPLNPPRGDGLFNQLDIVAALEAGIYLTGGYAANQISAATGVELGASLPENPLSPAVHVTPGVELSVVPIPEPASCLTLLFGLFALVISGTWRTSHSRAS